MITKLRREVEVLKSKDRVRRLREEPATRGPAAASCNAGRAAPFLALPRPGEKGARQRAAPRGEPLATCCCAKRLLRA